MLLVDSCGTKANTARHVGQRRPAPQMMIRNGFDSVAWYEGHFADKAAGVKRPKPCNTAKDTIACWQYVAAGALGPKPETQLHPR